MKKTENDNVEPVELSELAKASKAESEIKSKINYLFTNVTELETKIAELQEQRADELLSSPGVLDDNKVAVKIAELMGEVASHNIAMMKAQKLLQKIEEDVIGIKLMAAHDELNRLRPLLYQADAVVKMYLDKAQAAGDEVAKVHGLMGQQQLIIKQLTPRYVPPESSGPTFTDWNDKLATMDNDH